MRWLAFLLALVAFGAAADTSTAAASNDLIVARRALGDGNWYTAEHRAASAASLPALRTEARLVQLETLARAGRGAEIPARLDAWGNPPGEPFRYWRAFAFVGSGQRDAARKLLEAPFADPALAALAARLEARLETEAGNWKAADGHFAAAAAKLASNAVARVENACEWAAARRASGDAQGALDALKHEGALDAAGAAGDAARLLAADLSAATGDAVGARALRVQLVEAGEKTEAGAYVRAALALSDGDWLAGSTNAALAQASNAVARAGQGPLASLAGFNLGFKELSVPSARAGGAARIGALVRAQPDDPGAGDALLKLGDAHLVAGEGEEALKAYDRFLQAYPAHVQTLHALEGRGLAFKALGRDTEAVGAFARAAQMATNAEDRARCQFRQGDALVASGRFAEAAGVYGEVTSTNLAEFAQFQRGDALARAKLSKEAAEQFGKVMDGGGAYAVEAGLRLAAEVASAGRTETAIDIYSRLLGEKAGSNADLLDDGATAGAKARPLPALTPAQRARALESRGRANYRAYRFEDAERDFTAVAQIDSARSGEMRFFCSLCRYGAGRDDEAYASARALLSETPDSPLRADLLLWLGKFDFAQRNYAAAFAAFEDCSTNRHVSTGRRLDALVRAARCMAAQSDYPKVIELVSRIVKHPSAVAAASQETPETPILAEALLLQGEALIDQARFDEAVLVLERASRLPVSDEVRRRAAVLKADGLFARGADNSAYYQKAVDAYRTVQQDADVPPSMRLVVSFKLARALEKMHNYREASDQYYTNVVMAYVDGVRAGVLFDGNARAFFARAAFNLADAYEASGHGRQAERMLRYVVDAQVPSADAARQRIARLRKESGGK